MEGKRRRTTLSRPLSCPQQLDDGRGRSSKGALKVILADVRGRQICREVA